MVAKMRSGASAGLVIDRARAIRSPIGKMRISASTKSWMLIANAPITLGREVEK